MADKEIITKTFKKKLNQVKTELEKEALISEAVHDVILIARLNTNEAAFELIKSQFLVISNEDLK